MSEQAYPKDAPSQPKTENPIAILFDTDALLQILIANQMVLVHAFKRNFQIQPAIVEAVEVEIRKSRKFRARFTKELQKGIDSGTLKVLEVSSISSFVPMDARTTYDAIQTLGFEMSAILDYGEAYTYAAGRVLRAPVVSNDIRAIRAAKNSNIPLPSHVLRVFDFLVLCHQVEEVSAAGCDEIRKCLTNEGEWLPQAFMRAAFEDGLTKFYARLLEVSRPQIGLNSPQSELDVRLNISVVRPAKASS